MTSGKWHYEPESRVEGVRWKSKSEKKTIKKMHIRLPNEFSQQCSSRRSCSTLSTLSTLGTLKADKPF
jgi:hypothetical protein